ncbi:hypothetical protein DL98DRAFT_591258 [Cadophora sp. DSE1049]|nr:hypothetical protein DL98DRAFT_591258 [Cadophora sp. DSE1049]
MWFNLKVRAANPDYRRAFAKIKDQFLVEDLVGEPYIHLLQRIAPFKATDPRDKLFAILGLAQDSDRFHPDFQPDYSRDDPYTAADERIPTWVPRWDRKEVKGEEFTPLLNWKVSGDTVAEVESEFDPRILSLRGFRISSTKLVHHGLHKESRNINTIK